MRLLIIDDEPPVARALARQMRGTTIEIVLANSIRGGLDLLGAEAFDAVLVDQHLGAGPQGLDFLAMLSELYPRIYRLLMTGAESFEPLKGLAEAVLTKPFSKRELLAALTRCAAHRGNI